MIPKGKKRGHLTLKMRADRVWSSAVAGFFICFSSDFACFKFWMLSFYDFSTNMSKEESSTDSWVDKVHQIVKYT